MRREGLQASCQQKKDTSDKLKPGAGQKGPEATGPASH